MKVYLRAIPLLLLLGRPSHSGADLLPQRITDSIIAVGIVHEAAKLIMRPMGDFSVIDQSTGEIQKLKSGVEYIVEADNQMHLIIGKHLFLGPTRLLPGGPDQHVLIGERKYRGNIVFQPNKDATVTAIDEMGIEEYLQGVLPKEMNPAWPLEALKAQAVVARSFALNNLGKFSSAGYDLSDDSRSQIYSGLEVESDRVKTAVRATRGEILTWQGESLDVYFHSTCGGHTTDPQTAWGSKTYRRRPPKPLRGVRDRYCKISPGYRWATQFSAKDVLRAAARQKITGDALTEIRIARHNSTGYVSTLELRIEGRWKPVDAHALRMALGPKDFKSTQIQKITREKDGFIFSGRGYGHGVGLCQWGTRIQALKGRNYRKILGHYFPHADIARKEL